MKNKANGKIIDVKRASRAAGTKLITWHDKGTPTVFIAIAIYPFTIIWKGLVNSLTLMTTFTCLLFVKG